MLAWKQNSRCPVVLSSRLRTRNKLGSPQLGRQKRATCNYVNFFPKQHNSTSGCPRRKTRALQQFSLELVSIMTIIEKVADKLFLLMCSVIDQKCQGSLSCQHKSLKLVHLSSVENTQSKRASRRPSYHAQSENGGTEALVTTGLSPLGES